jgi:membrane-associated phospholipid phosphatase
LIVPSTKFVTHRTRPSEAQKILASGHADTSPNVWYDHASFPSGDTASACAVAASIGCSSALPWMPVFLTLAGGVGFLRVVACAHYPSDVFAGAAVGLFCVWLALQITRRWSLLEWAPLQTLRRIAVAGAIVITLWILLCEKARTSDLFLKAYVLPLAVLCVWTSVPPWLKRRKQRQCQSCRSATTGSTRAARSVG